MISALSSPTASNAPLGGPSVPPGSSRRTEEWIVVGGAVLVVAVLLVALAATGVLPILPRHSGGPTTFQSAEGAANLVAQGFQGQAWTLVVAEGIGLNHTYATPPISGTAGTGCSVMNLGADPSGNVSFPPTVGSVGSGAASAWLLIYRGSANGILLVTVLDGYASLYAWVYGTCAAVLGFFSPIPSGVLDSDRVAVIVNAAGGSAFLSAHPNAEASWVLSEPSLGPFGTVAPSWQVAYGYCGTEPGNLTGGMQFDARVGALNGSVLNTSQSWVAGCDPNGPIIPGLSGPPPVPTRIPLVAALALGTPTETAAGSRYWYNFTVQSAAGPLRYQDLSFSVMTPTGQAVVVPGPTVLVTQLTGCSSASYDWTTATWGSPTAGPPCPGTTGGAVQVSAGASIALSDLASLNGDFLLVHGQYNYFGTITVSIP